MTKTVMSESSTVGLDEAHLFPHCSQVSNVLVLGCALAVTFNLHLTLILAVPLNKTVTQCMPFSQHIFVELLSKVSKPVNV